MYLICEVYSLSAKLGTFLFVHLFGSTGEMNIYPKLMMICLDTKVPDGALKCSSGWSKYLLGKPEDA